MTPEAVTLKIDGEEFSSWEAVSVSSSIDSLCASFRLRLTDNQPGRVDRSVIRDQAACELWLGKTLFLTGYINDVDDDLSESSHTLTVSGRDKTGDLVDCSAVHSPGTFKNQKLEGIATHLLAPFGLKLRVDASTGVPFASFALEQGEKVLDAITRLCRMRGVMLKTDRDATVVIFKPAAAKPKATLELGRNVKRRRFHSTSAERFSQYIVKGQHQGGNYVEAKDAAQPKGTARDAAITRYRPLIIISDEQATAGGLKTRAQWEATVRMGRALDLNVDVAGWRDDNGDLYTPGDRVRYLSSKDGPELIMMITAVDFDLSNGTTSRLTLARPEAFTTEAILEPKKKKGKKDVEAGQLEALRND